MMIEQVNKGRIGKVFETPHNLVVLPGMLCNQMSWQPVLNLLDTHWCPVVYQYGVDDSFIHMATQVLQQAPAKFWVAGHSMGGRVALEICRVAPKRVQGLCLVGSEQSARKLGVEGLQETSQRLALLSIAEERGMAALADTWIPHLLPKERLADSSLVNTIKQMLMCFSTEEMQAFIAAGADRLDYTATLQTLQVPALFVVGDEDQLHPPERVRKMQPLLPHSELEVLSHCGHMPMLEYPQLLASLLNRWGKSAPRSPVTCSA